VDGQTLAMLLSEIVEGLEILTTNEAAEWWEWWDADYVDGVEILTAEQKE